jgi:FlaA1/EpsC-like NDP-sugar epimerase
MRASLGFRRIARWGALLALDAAGAALALQAALSLRFEGDVPSPWREAAAGAAALVAALHLAVNWTARLHRWSFRLAGLPDALRLVAAAALASGTFVLLCPWIVGLRMPRTVYALEFFLSASAFGVLRYGPRALFRWARRYRARGAARALIVGDGAQAQLLARDLESDRTSDHQLVGFVSLSPSAVGGRIEGHEILGTLSDLPALLRRHAISTVLLADTFRSGQLVRRIMEMCANSRTTFKIVPASLARADRLSVAMLEDVAPEDLLARDSVPFDEAAIRALVAGRRALVTGAAGSIGGELCRQLARFGVRQLVMVDMNENDLYLRGRRLSEQYPGLDVKLEVADVREARAIRLLGERHRPQDVFHAAAHKHVPLMEDAPDQAVKNNVFGTLHVAHMADACGAERFVLISTDKAVKPSSVMGATKRVAELVIRDLGRTSSTRMTAVRFGNVLGSAGSVVPIFKEQIAHGGPVTITHPECTRYFMTISEAVGLTLLAGLGGHGPLCVLEMGEPIRIADLARYMVTLTGRAPGEIPIVYTGLRPGEKLFEELLTEEEERSQVVRNRIRATQSPPPPPELSAWLAELGRLAELGDRVGVLSVLKALVPTYQVPRNVAVPLAPPPSRSLGPAVQRLAVNGGAPAAVNGPVNGAIGAVVNGAVGGNGATRRVVEVSPPAQE